MRTLIFCPKWSLFGRYACSGIMLILVLALFLNIIVWCKVSEKVSGKHIHDCHYFFYIYRSDVVPERRQIAWHLLVMWCVHQDFAGANGWVCKRFVILWCFAHTTSPTSWLFVPSSVCNISFCKQVLSLWLRDVYDVFHAWYGVLLEKVFWVWKLDSIWRLQFLRSFFRNSGPFLKMIEFSFALYCLYRLTVVSNTSSCCWPSVLSFIFFRNSSIYCSTRIHAFPLIPFTEYKVVFLLIFVNSLLLGFIEAGSSFATQSLATCRIFFLLKGLFFWLSLTVCNERKNCFFQRHPKKMLSPEGVLFVRLLRFWEVSSFWL